MGDKPAGNSHLASSSMDPPLSPRARGLEIVKRTKEGPFLIKLWQMLATDAHESTIAWTPDGLGFEVKAQKNLASDVLPRYFRHNRFASFQRQLNYFGFKRVGRAIYTHDLFQRDAPEGVLQIRRNANTSSCGFEKDVAEACDSDFPSMQRILSSCITTQLAPAYLRADSSRRTLRWH